MVYESELYHHGILGQKWGKKNGPPYPLGGSDHSVAEKRAQERAQKKEAKAKAKAQKQEDKFNKRAAKGKELYNQGKRETHTVLNFLGRDVAFGLGASAVSSILAAATGGTSLLAYAALCSGAGYANYYLTAKDYLNNRNLRAYSAKSGKRTKY